MWPGRRRDPRLREELQFHRDLLIEDYLRSGMERQEAERRAFLELGNVAEIEEAVRDARGRWLEDLANDLRYALRTLRRSPAFFAVAVLSLALGIGANSAIFGLIDAVMLRRLPVRDPDRLVQVTRVLDGHPGSASYPLFEHFRDNLKCVSGIFAQATSDQAVVLDGEDEFVRADLVSGSYFDVLGIEPEAGRLLRPADDVLSPSSPAAVISDRYWQRRFGRSPSAIGKAFAIRDRTFTIVGVMPASFEGTMAGRAPDLMLPLLMTMTDEQRSAADFNWLKPLARLKPGVTARQADAEVQVLYGGFLRTQAARAGSKERAAILRQRAAALPSPGGFNPVRDAIAHPLLILMGIVALILMLACVNVSGLLLARAAARQREISIRLAIGAGRGRLVRQFLTESLVLAALGAAIGFAVAGWSSTRLFAMFVNGRDVALSVAPGWRVLAFTSIVSVLACGIAGLAPALQAVHNNVNPAVKEFHTRGRRGFGKSLVVGQLAISMVLLVGATLFVGTLANLYAIDRGFDSDGVLVMDVRSARPYPAARAKAVQAALLDRLRTIPGVHSASAAQILPLGGSLWDRTVQVEGYEFRADEDETVGFNAIAPGYFTTLRTPLLSGREFNEGDGERSPKVAIVNQSFARHFFGGGPALGRRVASVNVTYEIVGVVRDAKYQGLRTGVIKTMYIPWLQRDGDQPSRYSYLARVDGGDPLRLVPGLDRVLRDADPGLRVRTARPYAEIVDRSVGTERILATLGAFFGVLALLIGALGMFGVLTFQVTRRTNELGVRMALGASRRALMSLVLRDLAAMVAAGIAIGAASALSLTGVARNVLFGLTASDPRVFGVAAGALGTAALAAGWLPARRASRVDPLVALRHE